MRTVKSIGVVLAAGVLVASGCAHKNATALDAAVKQFEQQTGVDVHLAGAPGEPVPAVAPGIELGPVDTKLARRSLPLLAELLLAYPPSVREEMVGHLVLVGKLRIDGVPFLGLAHPKQGRFEIALHPRTDPLELQRTVHHEIGHLFEAEAPYKESGFRDLSAGAYVGREPIRHWRGAARVAWLDQGFVTPYASKNPMEDFAELAALAWMRPDRARGLASRYPTIAAKLDLLTDIYRRTAPAIEMPWDGEGWRRWREAHPKAMRDPDVDPTT